MPVRSFAVPPSAAGRALALAVLLVAPLLAAADPVEHSDDWSLTLGGWGAVSRYDVLGLRHGVGTLESRDGRDLLEGRFESWGVSALLRFRRLDLGLLYEGAFLSGGADSAVLTPVAGFALELGRFVRLDLLGEFGGHRISRIGVSRDFTSSRAQSVWLPYAGVRPTLSVRLPAGPVRLVLSVAPFARWDLVRKDVTVVVSDGSAETRNTYDVGGSTFGLAAGAGVEL
jgi:hypothetical protein